jgi:hypothetical protein
MWLAPVSVPAEGGVALSSSIRRFCVCGAAVALLIAAASPAAASPETLKRAVGNILFAPFDIALSPIVAGYSIYNNMRDIDDSVGVRLAYPIPGYAWNLGLTIGAGAIREITGLIELLPGIFLLPFEADLDPLFAPPEKANALVDIETPPINVKFGIDYSSIPY